MVADPLILGGGDLKISDQNNWGGPNQKIKFGGAELNFREGGGAMNIVGMADHTPLF